MKKLFLFLSTVFFVGATTPGAQAGFFSHTPPLPAKPCTPPLIAAVTPAKPGDKKATIKYDPSSKLAAHRQNLILNEAGRFNASLKSVKVANGLPIGKLNRKQIQELISAASTRPEIEVLLGKVDALMNKSKGPQRAALLANSPDYQNLISLLPSLIKDLNPIIAKAIKDTTQQRLQKRLNSMSAAERAKFQQELAARRSQAEAARRQDPNYYRNSDYIDDGDFWTWYAFFVTGNPMWLISPEFAFYESLVSLATSDPFYRQEASDFGQVEQPVLGSDDSALSNNLSQAATEDQETPIAVDPSTLPPPGTEDNGDGHTTTGTDPGTNTGTTNGTNGPAKPNSGTPNGSPNGTPNGRPNGTPNGRPNGTPNGQPNGQPNGRPNGQPNTTTVEPAPEPEPAQVNTPPEPEPEPAQVNTAPEPEPASEPAAEPNQQ